MTTAFVERVRYSASGVGLAGGGSIPNVLAVKQVRRRHPPDGQGRRQRHRFRLQPWLECGLAACPADPVAYELLKGMR